MKNYNHILEMQGIELFIQNPLGSRMAEQAMDLYTKRILEGKDTLEDLQNSEITAEYWIRTAKQWQQYRKNQK
jgi:hypothetical protein